MVENHPPRKKQGALRETLTRVCVTFFNLYKDESHEYIDILSKANTYLKSAGTQENMLLEYSTNFLHFQS